MTKEEVLKLIREYQQYPKQTDYPEYREEINSEELEVHEAIADSLRKELEERPDFFKSLNKVEMANHIQNRINEHKKKQPE